jgi:large subunit ribosomal protein L33
MDRPIILFACEKCKRKNYSSVKSKSSGKPKTGGKLKLKKFCSSCKTHTPHKETKA